MSSSPHYFYHLPFPHLSQQSWWAEGGEEKMSLFVLTSVVGMSVFTHHPLQPPPAVPSYTAGAGKLKTAFPSALAARVVGGI